MNNMKKEISIYIHIPFCDHKCIYCDFYSIITSDNVNNFLDALKKEIVTYAELLRDRVSVNTIFFGGGTPSLMNPGYINEILSFLHKNFEIKKNAETTLETNPGTVDINKIREFKLAGINRLSIGIQSFNDDELKFLTRIHDKETAISTVQSAKDAGINNISIDLIFNLPGQTKEKWRDNLRQAVSLPIQHISAYSLILERGTILNKLVLDGKVKMQDSDYDAELYEETIDFLHQNDFIQYEVSNFAKEGYECQHNLAYWNYSDYLSFGTSAHSFINRKRWWNFSSLKMYINAINNSGSAIAGEEFINPEEQLEEFIMLSLRSKGISKQRLIKMFGNEWFTKNTLYLNDLSSKGYLVEDEELIKLTKKGYAICDEILKDLK